MKAAWGIGRGLFLRGRFFGAFAGGLVLLALGFAWPPLMLAGQGALALLAGLVALDAWSLYGPGVAFPMRRETPRLLSLGDDNPVRVHWRNPSPRGFRVTLLDEWPYQLQARADAGRELECPSGERGTETFLLHPRQRGEYAFGRLHAFLRTELGLVERRVSADAAETVPVYPSVLQMKRFELLALPRTARGQGLRKLRRIGHSYEFEQIKAYVPGDDRRAINWKATSRRQDLMVNQYEDERSQSVLCVLDCGRSMNLPFGGMSLLDYAVNASLVLANVALQRHDKAGLVAFDRGLVRAVPAERQRHQRQRLLEALYRLRESEDDADFEGLYAALGRLQPARSLVVLFTNFESEAALERALPVLRRLGRRHLLLLVLFENTEIAEAAEAPARTVREIYRQTVAADEGYRKRQMALRAARHGLQVILTRPEDLSLETLNKYLELKARGLI